MGIIHELPPSLINQIAAGEVVERPASVVKELLENAIDAGATRVEVLVERGGKDLVRVADNGRGIAREDLLLAFRPHATSKLAEADDLFRIRTLGFRGEALAAIAEVSKVRCLTRAADESSGSELLIEGGVSGPIRDNASPVGTVIEVRNLFFNTPVRRTFLRSDATEAGHVVEMVTRVALAHPQVHIVYRSAGRTIHDLPSSAGLRERVAAFFGQEVADSLVWVESRVEECHLRGYVAQPEQSRSSARGQYLFVGGRYVRDRSLGHALAEAYRGLLMVGRYPVAFLNLDIPPDQVDVNVHPTKIEVRFRDSHQVYSQVLATIRQTFLRSDLHARLQVPAARAAGAVPAPAGATDPGLPDRPAPPPLTLDAGDARRQEVASWFEPSRARPATGSAAYPPPRPEPEWTRNLPFPEARHASPPFDECGQASPAPVAERVADQAPGGSTAADRASLATLSPGHARPRAIQVHDSYLIVETSDGVVVIDQHALHERILFEELRQRVEQGGVESQRLLVPEPVELSAADAAEVLQRRETLQRLGLGVEPFSGDTVVVTSMPVMLGEVCPAQLVRDLAEHLRSNPVSPTPDAMLQDVLSLVACKAAVKAGQRLGPDEIAALLERRHLEHNTHHCPHGRPASLTFTKAELERQFGRI